MALFYGTLVTLALFFYFISSFKPRKTQAAYAYLYCQIIQMSSHQSFLIQEILFQAQLPEENISTSPKKILSYHVSFILVLTRNICSWFTVAMHVQLHT
jgi:hypothetical protein